MKLLSKIFFTLLAGMYLVFMISIFTKNTDTSAVQNPHVALNIDLNATQKTCIQNPKLSVFMYHYVREDDPNDTPGTRDLSVTPQNFEAHMKKIAELAKANKITLMKGDEFEVAFKENCFPGEKVWIFTSDDGWIDNATHLAPIAQKYEVPFIFGIISGKIDHPGFVSTQDIVNMSQNPLFTISSHTITHRDHSKLSIQEDKTEICESKKSLEAITKKPVNMFIFPMGKIGNTSPKHLKECGYTLAWSTHFGKNLDWKKLEPYIMNRVRIHHHTKDNFFENLANK